MCCREYTRKTVGAEAAGIDSEIMCGDTVDAEAAFVGLKFLDRRGDDGFWDDGNFWILCFFLWDD